MKRSNELAGGFDEKVEGGKEKEEGETERGGRKLGRRLGYFGIFTGGRIVGDLRGKFSLFLRRGFSRIVESRGEKRDELWEAILKGEML